MSAPPERLLPIGQRTKTPSLLQFSLSPDFSQQKKGFRLEHRKPFALYFSLLNNLHAEFGLSDDLMLAIEPDRLQIYRTRNPIDQNLL
jgi:hypothetical protein